jgi:hypothetical protein
MLFVNSLIFLVAVSGAAVHANTVPADSLHLFLVLDCGKMDMNTWETLRARAVETICALKPGDRVSVITAHSSDPQRFLDIVISKDKSVIDSGIKKIGTKGKDWFARAQLSTAVELAYEYADSGDAARQCCMVLSSGDISDEEFVRVKQVTELFAMHTYPLVFIFEHTSINREVLLGDMQIRFLDKPGIAEWLTQIRPVIDVKPESNLPKMPDSPRSTPKPAPEPRQLPAPAVITPPALPALSPAAVSDAKKTHVMPDCNGGKPAMAKVVIDFSKPGKIILLPPNKAQSDGVNHAKTMHDQQAKAAHLPAKDLQRGAGWPLGGGLILAVAILLIIGVVIKRIISRRKPANCVTDIEVVPTVLVAYVGKDRHELGSSADIREIVIGSGLGCAVYVTGDGVAPQHCRFTRNSKGFALKNSSETAITVNGLSVKSGGKVSLDLPAELELTPGVHVVLVQEEEIVNSQLERKIS